MDVIVAAATPRGRGALAVVRLSGDGCHALLAAIAAPMSGRPLRPGAPRRVRLRDAAGVFDDGVVVLGRGPHTYTGEDTGELTCHGNPLVVDRLVAAAQAEGARLAEPGEFTRRALVSGRLDLLGAEAVLQVHAATSHRGLEVARQGLDGRLAGFAATLREELLVLAAEVEARLDHPEDELAQVDDVEVRARCRTAAARAEEVAGTLAAGRAWVHGARVALVGEVNAGKSSLFNALLGARRALVHPEPGTTRDVVEAPLEVDGLALTLLDTAGERESTDPVEAAGLALAREVVEGADLVVVVIRALPGGATPTSRQVLARTVGRPRVVVYNGVDREDAAAPEAGWLPTVATEGEGVAAVAAAMVEALIGRTPRAEALVVASRRQADALRGAARGAREAAAALGEAGPAAAADALTHALLALDALSGADTREDVLSALFSRFCIGK